jgi:16S rRNA (cytosine967-C5)-methyltransferase
VRNAQLLRPGDAAGLRALGARFDLVFLDAPCTGSGAWRRRPDSKWRLRPGGLEERLRQQWAVLTIAADLVKPGGRLLYATCSVLPEENGEQVARFLAAHAAFQRLPWQQAWASGVGVELPASAGAQSEDLLLTPAQHGTDGFFIATLLRAH